jgi:hypothetical protein
MLLSSLTEEHMSQQDELSKFKKIISKLPEEKRKFLYKRLQSLPPDERENYIAEFNKKYFVEEKKEKEPTVEHERMSGTVCEQPAYKREVEVI